MSVRQQYKVARYRRAVYNFKQEHLEPNGYKFTLESAAELIAILSDWLEPNNIMAQLSTQNVYMTFTTVSTYFEWLDALIQTVYKEQYFDRPVLRISSEPVPTDLHEFLIDNDGYLLHVTYVLNKLRSKLMLLNHHLSNVRDLKLQAYYNTHVDAYMRYIISPIIAICEIGGQHAA